VDNGIIVGFVTVSGSSIPKAHLKRGGDGPDTWPVLLLGRMAVAQDRQRSGIGRILLKQVFTLAVQQHLTVGCAAVIVDAKPEAVAYYPKYGFKKTRAIEGAVTNPNQTRMFILIKDVMATIEPDSSNTSDPG
jgi:predicted N-acetyltransferase YhbS